MPNSLIVLGSTGSIGTQALQVCRDIGLRVDVLAAHRSAKKIEAQARQFRPRLICLTDEAAARDLGHRLRDLDVRIVTGQDSLLEAASFGDSDMVLNALVGIGGLLPTLAAIEAKKTVALANKETLVAGGSLVMDAARANGVQILPVDSEHSAIFQCLAGNDSRRFLHKIILTASGGPFFGKKAGDLIHMQAKDALRHPNWSMGPKVTIDSATLMNKGLELIEACFLFDVTPSEVEVIVNRESILHSAVEFTDGSVIAQLGVPDMKIPIQYALTWPSRAPCGVKPLDLAEVGALTFHKPDEETFSCLGLCREAFQLGGAYPCVANGANEAAVARFLEGTLGFPDIPAVIRRAMGAWNGPVPRDVSEILAADRFAKEIVHAYKT